MRFLSFEHKGRLKRFSDDLFINKHSNISTNNIHIEKDSDGTQTQTAYTAIRTETAQANTGRLKNLFDREKIETAVRQQREVGQEFGKNAPQAIAAVSDKLGDTRNYERHQIAKTLLEAELQNAGTEAEKAAVREKLSQVNTYLTENQNRYHTWKEGGAGRSILHGAAGGLATGNLSGVLAGSGTSFAAPYLDKVSDDLGNTGKALINTLGGAAVGLAAGGNIGGAAVGVNVDWNNRQLHPKETALADKYAEALKREVEKREGRKISSQEAAMRIRRQILRWVDKSSQDGYTDQAVISTIGMKGEDKALGYTWDYRDYATRNPQAYNNPKLFEEYRQQDKPEYRNLTWLHSGTKDSAIRQNERQNEELALNVADGLTGFVNPNPRVRATILTGIRSLKDIKPTVGGSDPLLAGAGNIRIPSGGNTLKDGIPDTALAAKNHQKNDSSALKGQGVGSSVPVPEAISVKIKNPDKTISEATYKSNPKHTPGQLGFKQDAGIEPKDAAKLLEKSVQIGKQRFAIDDKGHVHRYMGGDRKNEPWHWAGSTSDGKNPLSLTGQQKFGIKKAYPEQSRNKFLK